MSMVLMLVMFLPLILLLLWQSRSQQKKQKELEGKLKRGDRVVTTSGLIGTLIEFGDARHVRIEIAPGVKVQMLRSAIAGIDADDSAAKAKKEPAPSDKKS